MTRLSPPPARPGARHSQGGRRPARAGELPPRPSLPYPERVSRAIACHTQTVASLEGAKRHERFGIDTLPAAASRAWLAVCHAELGMFAEGRALGEEGLQMPRRLRTPGA